MAAVNLRDIAQMLLAISGSNEVKAIAAKAQKLSDDIRKGITQYAITSQGAKGQSMYAYEVDGFGNHLYMDDANVPSLLSLPYLGYCEVVPRNIMSICVHHKITAKRQERRRGEEEQIYCVII